MIQSAQLILNSFCTLLVPIMDLKRKQEKFYCSYVHLHLPYSFKTSNTVRIQIEIHMKCFAGEEAPVPEGGGVKPTFTERPVIRQSEEEANKIIFECRLVGEPRPEITWFHNDKQIVETERFKYSMELDATLYYLCRLEILNVDARDMGCYKAVARNASGEGHATINLTFEEGS